MSGDTFLTFLFSFAIRPPSYLVTSPWKARIHAITVYTFLQVWRIYKFAHRCVTGRRAIERACQPLLDEDALTIEEWSCLFGAREGRRSIWRIDLEFRLSKVLVQQNSVIREGTWERAGVPPGRPSLAKAALETTLSTALAKFIHPSLTDPLLNVVTTLMLIEHAIHTLGSQTQEEVSSALHQELLDEIWISIHSTKSLSDTQSEITLVEEKYEKNGIDWVKLGFQGKYPETDFRATGLLGLRHLHSFCTTYPVLGQKLVHESGSSQPLQITDPWYPFALVGIHLTQTIIKSLKAGLLHKTIIMKLNGDVLTSVTRTCQDLYDQLFEEFHAFWQDKVRRGIVKDVLAFERIYSEFKQKKRLL